MDRLKLHVPAQLILLTMAISNTGFESEVFLDRIHFLWHKQESEILKEHH